MLTWLISPSLQPRMTDWTVVTSGVVTGGQLSLLPLPQIWGCRKISSCWKIVIQKCKIWGWKPPLCGNFGAELKYWILWSRRRIQRRWSTASSRRYSRRPVSQPRRHSSHGFCRHLAVTDRSCWSTVYIRDGLCPCCRRAVQRDCHGRVSSWFRGGAAVIPW